MSFLGKVVLVTGASSGIGATTAIHFSNLGASLGIAGRNETNLNEVSNKCIQVHDSQPKPLILIGDLSKEEDVIKLFEKTVQTYGKLDVLVNNAGIFETGSTESTNLEQYDRIFNINVRSVYQLTTLAVPYLIKTKGNVVNVSSINGTRAFSGVLAYCMSKAAIDHFTRSVALDLATKEVRVNSVNPGVILTNIHKRSGMTQEQYEQFLEHSKQTHALGRPGNAKEVAKTIVFLASEDASFITGVSVAVDGGRHAMCPR